MSFKNFEILDLIFHKPNRLIHYIKNKKDIKQNILICHIFILIGSMIYGGITGSFVGGTQILVNSIKIPIILFGLLYISLPIFYVFDVFIYSKIKFDQIFIILLSGYIITTLILIAFAPLILLFSITTINEKFLVLLNTGIGAMALFCGLVFIYQLFNKIHNNLPANISLLIGYFIILFSGPQLIWALRPYLHSVDGFTEPVKSNFYIEISKVAADEPILTIILIGLFSLVTLFIIMNFVFIENKVKKIEPVDTILKKRQNKRIKKVIIENHNSKNVEDIYKPENIGTSQTQSNPFQHPDYLQFHLNNKPLHRFKSNDNNQKS